MTTLLNECTKLPLLRLMQPDRKTAGHTCELTDFREMLAADFHDETGNLLLTIIHQALLLKMHADKDALPLVESILDSSNQLYAVCKHLLWNLNHESDDPQALFEYIAAFGQSFYNHFDVCFSAETEAGCSPRAGRLAPLAAMNLTFIFKEAMNNVIKHADAKEVILKMGTTGHRVIFELADDGTWKEPDTHRAHYGLKSIERRCTKNGFTCLLRHNNGKGTQMEIGVPVIHTAPLQQANHEQAEKISPTLFPAL